MMCRAIWQRYKLCMWIYGNTNDYCTVCSFITLQIVTTFRQVLLPQTDMFLKDKSHKYEHNTDQTCVRRSLDRYRHKPDTERAHANQLTEEWILSGAVTFANNSSRNDGACTFIPPLYLSLVVIFLFLKNHLSRRKVNVMKVYFFMIMFIDSGSLPLICVHKEVTNSTLVYMVYYSALIRN